MLEIVKDSARVLKRHVEKKLRRRELKNSIRPSDVFIVTYPKSGTIWLSFLIASVLKSDPEEELTFLNFLKYTPDMNDSYFSGGHLGEFSCLPDPRFFYVHAPHEPLFKKVIYILRDPRDVMVSYYHQRLMTDNEFRCSMKEFVSSDDHFPCRWDEHVSGWLLENRHPGLCMIRYEELHKDTKGALKRALDYAGLEYTKADINRAVEASKFEKMRSLEDKYGVAGPEVLKNTKERFVRKGKIGGWRDELDEECVRILDMKYGAVMRQVGYQPSSCSDIEDNLMNLG